MADPVTITLSNPVTAHGEEISTITLREPKGKDIIACGYPMRMSEGGAEPIAVAICKYIARLGDVPPSTVDRIGPDDFNLLMSAVLGFFGKSEEAGQTETG